jgi:hypothetical protein
MKFRAMIKVLYSILFAAITFSASSIVRAAPGDLDLSFNPPIFSSSGSFFSIYANVLQPDGKIVVGGAFTSVNGINQISLARLNADGSRDATFISPFVTGSTQTTIYALTLQADGKILIGGTLVTPSGTKTLVRTVRSILLLSSRHQAFSGRFQKLSLSRTDEFSRRELFRVSVVSIQTVHLSNQSLCLLSTTSLKVSFSNPTENS